MTHIIPGQAGLEGGAGAVTSRTPRATLASDDPAVSRLSTPISVTGVTARSTNWDALGAQANRKLFGFSCAERAGTPAVAALNVRLGTIASPGAIVAHVELAANGNQGDVFPLPGLDAATGVHVELVAGTVDVTVFYRDS